MFDTLVAGLVKQADQVDVAGIVQFPGTHLAHGKRNHAARRDCIRRHRAGQFATPDLLSDQPLQGYIHRPVGQPGQGAGDLFQRPYPAQIAQRGPQRHAPLGLPQTAGKGVSGQTLQRRKLGVQNRIWVHHKAGAQKPLLAQHQALEVGRAGGDSGQKRRCVLTLKAVKNIGPGAGVIGAGLAGYKAGKCHRATMAAVAGRVNDRLAAMGRFWGRPDTSAARDSRQAGSIKSQRLPNGSRQTATTP